MEQTLKDTGLAKSLFSFFCNVENPKELFGQPSLCMLTMHIYTWTHTCIHILIYTLTHIICNVCMLSCFSSVQLFKSLWTVADHAPLSMGFSRQEFYNGRPRPPPGDLPNPGIEPVSLMSPELTGRFFTIGFTWESKEARKRRLSGDSLLGGRMSAALAYFYFGSRSTGACKQIELCTS